MKKILMFLTLITAMFTLTGCGEDTKSLDEIEELSTALENMESIENLSMKITSEIVDVVSIEIYSESTTEFVRTYMEATMFSNAIEIFGVVNGDNIEFLEPVSNSSNPTYMTASIESISATTSLYEEVDLYASLEYIYEDGYYVAKDLDMDIPGYEEADEIPSIKIKVEDGYITEIIFELVIDDQDLLVTLELYDIGTTTIDMPNYYDTTAIAGLVSEFGTYDCDITILPSGFNVSSLQSYIEFTAPNYALSIEGLSYNVEYLHFEGLFMVNGTSYDTVAFFSNFTDTGFTEESWELVIEVFEIYE